MVMANILFLQLSPPHPWGACIERHEGGYDLGILVYKWAMPTGHDAFFQMTSERDLQVYILESILYRETNRRAKIS